MTRIAFLRHGPTDWNAQSRIQGREDVGLSDEGLQLMESLRLPAPFDAARVFTSPLSRARATAQAIMAPQPHEAEDSLIEMDWGQWSGETVGTLRERLGDAFLENEARGLDFRAEGGESPRDVMARLSGFARKAAHLQEPVLAITHKGVIRAALAMGTGWDMKGRAPVKLAWRALHVFDARNDGSLKLVEANVMLKAAAAP
ncbi:MAG TPA: histidine phosphatase family protein [Micropepsaceae bacterium]|nr:histidine phosphatase family protein [Micropepsaceae bacterium]